MPGWRVSPFPSNPCRLRRAPLHLDSAFDQLGVRDAGDDQLGDPHAAADDKRLAAEIDQDDLDLSAIIGVDGSRSVKDGNAVADGKARTRPDWPFAARRQRDGNAGRDHRARRPARSRPACSAGTAAMQIETRGKRALIGRQRQVGAVRQPHDAQLDGSLLVRRFHPLCLRKRRHDPLDQLRATSSFDCGGQDSTPDAVTRMNRIAVAAHDAGFRRNIIGKNPVAAFLGELGFGVGDDVVGLRRKSDDERRAAGFAMGDRCQDVGILDQRRAVAACLPVS